MRRGSALTTVFYLRKNSFAYIGQGLLEQPRCDAESAFSDPQLRNATLTLVHEPDTSIGICDFVRRIADVANAIRRLWIVS
jgi:hypothetical protein